MRTAVTNPLTADEGIGWPYRTPRLHYHPKLDLATDEVHDVEAPIRWSHPG